MGQMCRSFCYRVFSLDLRIRVNWVNHANPLFWILRGLNEMEEKLWRIWGSRSWRNFGGYWRCIRGLLWCFVQKICVYILIHLHRSTKTKFFNMVWVYKQRFLLLRAQANFKKKREKRQQSSTPRERLGTLLVCNFTILGCLICVFSISSNVFSRNFTLHDFDKSKRLWAGWQLPTEPRHSFWWSWESPRNWHIRSRKHPHHWVIEIICKNSSLRKICGSASSVSNMFM